MTGLTNGRETRKTRSRMREAAKRRSRRPGRDGAGTGELNELIASPQRRAKQIADERKRAEWGRSQRRLAKHSNQGERRKRNPFIEEAEERSKEIEQPDLPEAEGLTPQEFSVEPPGEHADAIETKESFHLEARLFRQRGE